MRGLEAVMVKACEYANNYPNVSKPGLLLIGPTGTGKTHLAVAALRKLMSRARRRFLRLHQSIERIRSGYDAEASS